MSIQIENVNASSQLMGLSNYGKNTTTYNIGAQTVPASSTLTFTTTITMPRNKCLAISTVNWGGVTFNSIQNYYFPFGAVNESSLLDSTNGVLWRITKSYSGTTITITMSVVNNLSAAPTTIPAVTVTILTRFFGYPWN